MKVIIVGCGRVGSTIARELSGQNHDVVVIDRRSEAFRRLGESFSGRTVTGIGFDRAVLSEAGIDAADAVVAVTNGDNSNILIARVARELFSVERVVARIYDPRRAAIYARLGIPTVASVTWASQRILGLIVPREGEPQWVDPSNRFSIVERPVSPDLVGISVADMSSRGSEVLLVTRNGRTSRPDPTLLLQEGDAVHLLNERVGDDSAAGGSREGGNRP